MQPVIIVHLGWWFHVSETMSVILDPWNSSTFKNNVVALTLHTSIKLGIRLDVSQGAEYFFPQDNVVLYSLCHSNKSLKSVSCIFTSLFTKICAHKCTG